jgi:hypothetical protein
MQAESLIGKTLVCAETGKTFVGAADGITTNYAHSSEGEILSDEGVNIREQRGLLDRSKPFYAYVSSDGKHITGWKGNVLGTIMSSHSVRLTRQSYTHGSTIQSYVVRDIHGGMWHGRGNPGICITLRAYKTKAA